MQRMCDIDNSTIGYFENPIDFEFIITGHLYGSNEAIYVTEPIFFHRHKNRK